MENRLDEILNTLKSNVITHKAKYLEIRYDLIEEVIKYDKNDENLAFSDEKERIEYFIECHYSCPFENVNEIFNYYKESHRYNEETIMYHKENYNLTNEEMELLILMSAENLFIPMRKFILMAIKLNFKVFDEEGNLMNDGHYVNGE